MRDIMNKLILYGAVLEKLDVDALMKESREANLLTASIRTSVDNDIAQANSEVAQVGSVSASLTQLVTPK